MYLIVASLWYRYCAIRWKYSKMLMHNRASVKGMLRLAKGCERVAAKTGTITCLSAFISLSLHCITWLYGLLNWSKQGYGDSITQSWLNMSILECCSSKAVTHSIKCLSIPRERIWRIPGTIIVIGEMHFIFQITPCESPAAQSSRYCLASHLSISSPWVTSSIFCVKSW